jgi:hypothetical protein
MTTTAEEATMTIRKMKLRDFRDAPYYPDAHVALVDALSDYLYADEDIGIELLREGEISVEQFRVQQEKMEPYRAILKELEEFGTNPDLCGLIRYQSGPK